MMTQKKMDTARVIALIEETSGNVSRCAKKLGCARNTLSAFISNHSTCQQALDNARESMLDEGESSLYDAVKDGESWAICFFLKTKGKSRGYIERSEHTGADGKDLTNTTVNVYIPTNGREPS